MQTFVSGRRRSSFSGALDSAAAASAARSAGCAGGGPGSKGEFVISSIRNLIGLSGLCSTTRLRYSPERVREITRVRCFTLRAVAVVPCRAPIMHVSP